MRHIIPALAGILLVATALGDARAQRRPGTLPEVPQPAGARRGVPAADEDRTPPRPLRTDNLPEDDDGVVRTRATKPGVLETTGDKPPVDPSRLGKPDTPEDTARKLSEGAEDVIEWKTNFEKGVKCRKLPLNAKIRLDFEEIALGDLTKFISCITEQNFLLAGGVNKSATISILSPKPVTAYEAYKAYLSALEANGLTIVPKGSFLEIVANGEARSQGAPIFGVGKQGPNDARIVTRLVQLEHIQAAEIIPVIDKFKTKAADVTVYAPTNTIILTDTGANIRRVLSLVAELDVPIGKEKVWIRPIQYADANEVLSMLQNLFGGEGAASGGGSAQQQQSAAARARARRRAQRAARQRGRTATPSPSEVVGEEEGGITSVAITKMLADERTNSIIFVTTRTSYLRIDRLIRRVDVPIPGEGQIHIHNLENADANDIAQTLSNLAQGSTGARAGARGAQQQQQGGGGAASGALFEGEIKITAYEPTNSLVIESSLKDYLSLQKVVRQLDVRQKQVYVEAIVMEISQSKQRDLGLSGSGGAEVELGGETLPLLFGVGGLGLDVSAALQTLSDGGGAVGLQGPLLDVSAGSGQDGGATGGSTFSIPAFGFLLRAIQTTSNVNVLSTPHILTVENEEAEIQVGQRQPFRNATLGGLGSLSGLAGLGGLTGGAQGTQAGVGGLSGLAGLSGLSGLGSQVQYVDIDLTLKIKPQVNSSDFVRLEIDQSLDNLDGFFADAPITSTRKVRNVVVVRDGQPVVIGGLMQDQETESVEKVPFLGDIPLIGLLFRRTSTQVEKRNLLVIIVPHVIKDPSDLKRIHEQRKREYMEMARMMALRAKEFDGELDYRKRSGLLEEMHETIERAESERELREEAIFESSDFDTVGPPETHDIEYDPSDQVPEAVGGDEEE